MSDTKLTFREECANSKAKRDDGCGEGHEEDKKNRRRSVSNNSAFLSGVDTKEDRHYEDRDEKK